MAEPKQMEMQPKGFTVPQLFLLREQIQSLQRLNQLIRALKQRQRAGQLLCSTPTTQPVVTPRKEPPRIRAHMAAKPGALTVYTRKKYERAPKDHEAGPPPKKRRQQRSGDRRLTPECQAVEASNHSGSSECTWQDDESSESDVDIGGFEPDTEECGAPMSPPARAPETPSAGPARAAQSLESEVQADTRPLLNLTWRQLTLLTTMTTAAAASGEQQPSSAVVGGAKGGRWQECAEQQGAAKQTKGGGGSSGSKAAARGGKQGKRRMKRKRRQPKLQQEEMEGEEEEEEEERFVVEAIVGARWQHGEREFLIKWEGYSEGDNTWEPSSSLDQDLAEYTVASGVDLDVGPSKTLSLAQS